MPSSRAEMGPLSGWVYSLSARGVPFVEGTARLLGMGGKLDAAFEAADGAKTALADAIKEAEPSTLRLLATKSKDIAEGLSKLDTINSEVPNVIRIGLRDATATGVAAVNGGLQWGSYVATHVATISNLLPSGDQAAIDAAVSQFRQSLSHVP
jgi:hypothetical protein